MRYISFMTQNCTHSARTHSIYNEVENLLKKIEKDQSFAAWRNFYGTSYFRKAIGVFRVVSHKRVIDDDIVICFIDCSHRGSNTYKKLLKKKNPDSIFRSLLPTDIEIEKYLENRNDIPTECLPKLNSVEYGYLYDSIDRMDRSDGMVFESREWLERMEEQSIKELLTRYYDLVFKITNNEYNAEEIIAQLDGRQEAILFRFFPDHKKLFLIYPLPRRDKNLEKELKEKYSDILNLVSANVVDDLLICYSRRSYPSLILTDETMWKDIEKNAEGNLALSPEESKILDSVSSKRNSEKIYPLFINGRPGSGKTTILQYLFSEQLFLHLKKGKDQRLSFPPLYLTYSERLLQSAKKSVGTILRCNAEIATDGLLIENSIIFDECFSAFHQFLLRLLPDKTRKNYELDKKIDFQCFKILWNEKRKADPNAELRKLSPELVWHVLRTYIKGMRQDAENDFDSSAYEELPVKQKTVQQTTFDIIYQDIWKRWYKNLCEKGHWDDQDIVFQVLNLENADLSRYPAIFCDEAQDFNSLELELLMKLSIFSKRSISPQDIRRVPFAFAGDPFQTLNPTGFDWVAVQANFHENIVQELDKTSCGNLEFNYQELSFNYRSTKYIVGFCNLLQLLRGILFDLKEIRPQRTWFEENSSMPVFFDIEDTYCEKNLIEQSELIIILPCQEGEEENYVNNDIFLKKLAEKSGEIRNFLSPMSAKGLEFSRVVLYKFGSYCYENYPYLLRPLLAENYQSHTENRETSLPLEYFMNRLYVAASRAKRWLIIVDDKDGINMFWDHDKIKDIKNLLKKYPYSDRNNWSSEDLNYVQQGFKESWTEDRDDPVRLGEQLYEAGKSERDPYKLRLAEANFKRAGKTYEAGRSLALRFEIEEKLEEAGDKYLELSDTVRSLKCFWKAKKFNKILQKHQFSNTLEQRASGFWESSKNIISCNNFLQFLYDEIQSSNKTKILGDSSQWTNILDKLIDSFSNFRYETVNWSQVFCQIKELEEAGLHPKSINNFATIAYLAKNYKEVLRIWDESGNPSSKDKLYIEAKAYTTEFPEKIRWLSEIGNHKEIIESWKSYKSTKLSKELSSYVALAYINENRHEDMLSFLKIYPDEATVEKALMIAVDKNKKELICQYGTMLIKIRIEQGKWKEAIELTSTVKVDEDIRRKLNAVLVYNMSVSVQFLTDTTHELKEIAGRYLKTLFIDSQWEKIVSIKVAGAAIERANKIIDSLDFYEYVWKRSKIKADEQEIKFAKERWIKCKMRFADHLDRDKKDQKAGSHREEADILSRTIGINKNNIPEYPNISSEDEPYLESNKDQNIEIDKDIREDIIMLKNKRTPEYIAELFHLDIELVKQVIKEEEE